jgi:hypothetical protein
MFKNYYQSFKQTHFVLPGTLPRRNALVRGGLNGAVPGGGRKPRRRCADISSPVD